MINCGWSQFLHRTSVSSEGEEQSDRCGEHCGLRNVPQLHRTVTRPTEGLPHFHRTLRSAAAHSVNVHGGRGSSHWRSNWARSAVASWVAVLTGTRPRSPSGAGGIDRNAPHP